MTPERMKEAFDACSRCLHKYVFADVLPKEMSEAEKKRWVPTHVPFAHLSWMCGQGKDFVDEGRINKANRWLGFLQGFLYSQGYATIDEMKHWNMPKSEEL